MSRQTLLLIKPNAFRNRHVGHIISILEEAGFNLLRIKDIQFTPESAAVFYDIHRG
ncbi:MAG TPA: nucleoside-diphosphate kinase, partial [Candidatus Syntrophosphaera sp.]|nr:nucleoside-diphosphate kinase [Candidatus Syntrophosphaera sp.]